MDKEKIISILKERQGSYGNFCKNAQISMELLDSLWQHEEWLKAPADFRASIIHIIFKSCRMMCKDVRHKDSIDDIQGYAELIRMRGESDQLNDEKESKNKETKDTIDLMESKKVGSHDTAKTTQNLRARNNVR